MFILHEIFSAGLYFVCCRVVGNNELYRAWCDDEEYRAITFVKKVAREEEAGVCAVMNEVEYREGASYFRKLDENGLDVSLGKCPEDITTSKGRKDDGEAEVADSEIVLGEPSEKPEQEGAYGRKANAEEIEGHHGFRYL